MRSTGIKICVTAAAISTLAACGSSSSSGSTSSAGNGASSTSAGSATGKKIVYVPGLTGNPFYTSVGCGAADQAKKLGLKFATQGAATYDPALQTQIVNALTASKPAGIMISITDPVAMAEPLKAAKAAGIKIITIDGDLNDKSIALSNIQSNDFKGGAAAGNALAKLINGKGDVMAIDNKAGNSIVAGQRASGFEAAIKKFPGIHFLGLQYSDNQTSKAASIASTAATTNSKLTGIYALETNNTEGAATGLQEAKKTNQVKLVGFDTSDPIVQAIEKGTISADIVQDPFGEGQMGVKSIVAAIEGKSVPKDQTSPFVVATPANIHTAKVQQYIYKTHC